MHSCDDPGQRRPWRSTRMDGGRRWTTYRMESILQLSAKFQPFRNPSCLSIRPKPSMDRNRKEMLLSLLLTRTSQSTAQHSTAKHTLFEPRIHAHAHTPRTKPLSHVTLDFKHTPTLLSLTILLILTSSTSCAPQVRHSYKPFHLLCHLDGPLDVHCHLDRRPVRILQLFSSSCPCQIRLNPLASGLITCTRTLT